MRKRRVGVRGERFPCWLLMVKNLGNCFWGFLGVWVLYVGKYLNFFGGVWCVPNRLVPPYIGTYLHRGDSGGEGGVPPYMYQPFYVSQ